MNILHIISGDFLAGSESYAVALAERQIDRGDRVFIIGSNLFTPTRAKFHSVLIHRRSFFRRIYNVIAVQKFIRQNCIDIVHAHSRAASWVACFATRLTRTAYVSSLHGRMHIHRSSRKSKIYGQYALPVCEDIAGQMLTESSAFLPERTIVVRNGIA